ncbi:MAG: 3-dehydroquinate synthase, partial [Gammaproteobacteria bacterium]|nr:3-dehydroquinate synthase [Gammaproteobacteria bacterium]
MSLVYVQTQQGRYPIQVSRNILGQIGTAIPIDASKIILISNQQVYDLYGEQVKKSLQIHTKEILTYFLPDGEIYKNLSA